MAAKSKTPPSATHSDPGRKIAVVSRVKENPLLEILFAMKLKVLAYEDYAKAQWNEPRLKRDEKKYCRVIPGWDVREADFTACYGLLMRKLLMSRIIRVASEECGMGEIYRGDPARRGMKTSNSNIQAPDCGVWERLASRRQECRARWLGRQIRPCLSGRRVRGDYLTQ